MRLAAIALLSVVAIACGTSEPLQADRVTGRPVRPSVQACLVSDHYTNPVSIEELPGAVSDINGWTKRFAAQSVAAPGPAPIGCGFAPTRTVAFDDADGYRWWLLLSVVQDGTDMTPALPPPTGAMTITWVVQASFDRYRSISIEDSQGLLLAANVGRLLLGPGDAGGLAMTLGADLTPTYQGDCGRTRELAVVFSGGSNVTLRPGERSSILLAPGAVSVWNVDAFNWVGAPSCTDLSPFISTLAWRASPN
jgi:hypothetical protein